MQHPRGVKTFFRGQAAEPEERKILKANSIFLNRRASRTMMGTAQIWRSVI